MKVKDLLTTEETWVKRGYAKTDRGYNTYPTSNNAASWCLRGAIIYCYPVDETLQIFERVRAKIRIKLTEWNDAPTRTFAEVRQLIEELDI